MTKYKIGSGLTPFSPCAERFVTNGYRDPMSFESQVAEMAKVKGMQGIGLDYPGQFSDAEVTKVKSVLDSHGMELCTLELGLYPDRKWKLGTYTSSDPNIRREAIEMSKRGLDIAREMGAHDVLLWPGQDGFEYPFQVDYQECWMMFIDGIAEVAAHAPDVNIAIEYKPKEPRGHCFIRNAGTLLYILQKIGLSNIGATVDFGHSLVAGENPAEAASLLANEGKLFQVHCNDNYRDWDADMIVGTVNLWETLEFFYWITRRGYDGWYIMDVFPYREDGYQAIQQCVLNTEKLLSIAESAMATDLQASLSKMDSIAASKIVWDLMSA